MKKVLVTGSQGYIGTLLMQMLLKNGYECVGYDLGMFEDCYLYPTTKKDYIKKDIKDLSEKEIEKCDVLIHLAGVTNDPFVGFKPEKAYNYSRKHTFKLATLCKKLGVKFIFSSSCSVYGIGGDKILDENAIPNPQTTYALNKWQIEQDLSNLSDKSFSPIALRLATLFGASPMMRFDIVVNMLVGMGVTTQKIVLNSDGKAWRPNVHIKDVAMAFIESVNLDYSAGRLLTLNVGSEGNNYQIIEIANIVKECIDGCNIEFLNKNPQLDKKSLIKDSNVRDGIDVRTYRISFEKIKDVLGFKCNWGLEEGINDMIKKFKRINLHKNQFNSINYYRLRKVKDLYERGVISEELCWANKE